MTFQSRNRKIRVLHISTAKTWRGGENQIFHLIKATQDKIETHLLSPESALLSKRANELSITQHTFVKRGGLSFSASNQIKSICSEYNIDVVHAHDAHAHTYVYIAGLLGNKSQIIVTRRVDFRPSQFSLFKYNYRKVKKVVTVSNYIGEILMERGVKKSKLKTIYSGISLENKKGNGSLHTELDWGNDNKIIGFVGASVDHKNPLLFLKVAKSLLQVDPALRFLMCGQDGELTDSLDEYIRSNHLSESVVHVGFQNDIQKIWNSLDILLVTSKMEGLGSSVLEAMSYGVPVISSIVGGLPEIIHHHQNGLLCSPDDEADFIQNVILILNDHKLRAQIIERASEYVKDFHFKRMAEEYLSVYTEV